MLITSPGPTKYSPLEVVAASTGGTTIVDKDIRSPNEQHSALTNQKIRKEKPLAKQIDEGFSISLERNFNIGHKGVRLEIEEIVCGIPLFVLVGELCL